MRRIVFMGTPAFAVPALEMLHQGDNRIVAAFSRPPTPAGRGKKLSYSPVHQASLRLAIPCFTLHSLKDPDVAYKIRAMAPDFIVVAAYGLLLPKAILEIAPCINIHASLLPRWRGAAPIQRAVLAGDAATGVTIMRMDEGMDTGGILLAEGTEIRDDMHAGDVHDVLMRMGALLITDAVNNFNDLTETPQNHADATYAPKIDKEEARPDWSRPAREIFNRIRAFAPYPGCRFLFMGEEIKLLEAEYRICDHGKAPGTIVNGSLYIACADGVIIPKVLQRPGKNMLPASECLRGMRFAAGETAG
jgi:methionyl-tRNA formyltransferase